MKLPKGVINLCTKYKVFFNKIIVMEAMIEDEKLIDLYHIISDIWFRLPDSENIMTSSDFRELVGFMDEVEEALNNKIETGVLS